MSLLFSLSQMCQVCFCLQAFHLLFQCLKGFRTPTAPESPCHPSPTSDGPRQIGLPGALSRHHLCVTVPSVLTLSVLLAAKSQACSMPSPWQALRECPSCEWLKLLSSPSGHDLRRHSPPTHTCLQAAAGTRSFTCFLWPEMPAHLLSAEVLPGGDFSAAPLLGEPLPLPRG